MTDDKHIVIIPRQHVIKPGTLKQILAAAEISEERFQELLCFSGWPTGKYTILCPFLKLSVWFFACLGYYESISEVDYERTGSFPTHEGES
jgi:hypothetical protein